jgi:hypothetical protein
MGVAMGVGDVDGAAVDVVVWVFVGVGSCVGIGVGNGTSVDVGSGVAVMGGHVCPSVTRKSLTWMLCGLWPFSHACVAIVISTNGFVWLPVAWHIVTFSPAWATLTPNASKTASTRMYFMISPFSILRAKNTACT